jgi:hypothetical protein
LEAGLALFEFDDVDLFLEGIDGHAVHVGGFVELAVFAEGVGGGGEFDILGEDAGEGLGVAGGVEEGRADGEFGKDLVGRGICELCGADDRAGVRDPEIDALGVADDAGVLAVDVQDFADGRGGGGGGGGGEGLVEIDAADEVGERGGGGPSGGDGGEDADCSCGGLAVVLTEVEDFRASVVGGGGVVGGAELAFLDGGEFGPFVGFPRKAGAGVDVFGEGARGGGLDGLGGVKTDAGGGSVEDGLEGDGSLGFLGLGGLLGGLQRGEGALAADLGVLLLLELEVETL